MDRWGLALLLDRPIPEHIVQTFGLVATGDDEYKSVSWNDAYRVLRNGEALDLTIRKWLIIFNGSDWHAEQAMYLSDQLRSLIEGVEVVSIPVRG